MPRGDDPSPLSVLGLTRADEELYRALLRHAPLPRAALDELIDEPATEIAEAVARLTSLGLVEESGAALVAAPPDQVLGRLIGEESSRLHVAQDRLEALRRHLPALEADHRSGRRRTGPPSGVELSVEGDLVAILRALAAESTGEMLWLRPDIWRMDEAADLERLFLDLLSGGRPSRAIYPARVLEEAPEELRVRVQHGEQVRVLAEVPGRMVVMGDQVALVPQVFGVPNRRRLVVRQPSLVGALRMLFDHLWERAIAVPGLDRVGEERAVGQRRLLLDQLARGAKDEQIARALGLSLRTVRRRVAELLDELGATSRFQAGVEAVRRGWV